MSPGITRAVLDVEEHVYGLDERLALDRPATLASVSLNGAVALVWSAITQSPGVGIPVSLSFLSFVAFDWVFLALLPMAHNYTLGCPGVLGALAHQILPGLQDQP